MVKWSQLNSSHKGPSPFDSNNCPYTNKVDLDLLYGSSYWQSLPSKERRALHGMLKCKPNECFDYLGLYSISYRFNTRKRPFKEPNNKAGFYKKANPQQEALCYLHRIGVLLIAHKAEELEDTIYFVNPLYLQT